MILRAIDADREPGAFVLHASVRAHTDLHGKIGSAIAQDGDELPDGHASLSGVTSRATGGGDPDTTSAQLDICHDRI